MSSRAALLCILLSLSVGCLAPGPENEPQEPSARTQQFLRVTKEVPTFGGVSRENGQWVVSVFNAEEREAAEARLADIFAEEAADIAVRVRAPRGGASELTKETARDVMSVPGVGRLDFDETVGYIRVGLIHVEAVEPVQVKLGALGIPLDQVILEVVRPIVLF
jgi:hypothetical protein